MSALAQSERNHPLATRMCVIAGLSYNITLACTFGTFSVVLKAAELKMGAARDVSSLGIALALLGIAISAPVVGSLAIKFSLRTVMVVGALMQAVAYVILAFCQSVTVYLLAYGLLIGPGLAATATVLPATLVTRWFIVHRGRALGLVFAPVGLAIMPLLATIVLARSGLATTYVMLACLAAVLVLPMLFVVDYPPAIARSAAEPEMPEMPTGPSTSQLLKRRDFWALSLAYAAIAAISSMLTAFLVPMAMGWGIDATRAASLLSISSFAGMGGTIVFGMIADRFGGVKILILLGVDTAVLWGLVLIQPPYPLLVPLVALLGFHAAALVGVFSVALSEYFAAGFGRALGLSTLISLPFCVVAIPISARIFMTMGSFNPALIGMIAFLLITTLLVGVTKGPQSELSV